MVPQEARNLLTGDDRPHQAGPTKRSPINSDESIEHPPRAGTNYAVTAADLSTSGKLRL